MWRHVAAQVGALQGHSSTCDFFLFAVVHMNLSYLSVLLFFCAKGTLTPTRAAPPAALTAPQNRRGAGAPASVTTICAYYSRRPLFVTLLRRGTHTPTRAAPPAALTARPNRRPLRAPRRRRTSRRRRRRTRPARRAPACGRTISSTATARRACARRSCRSPGNPTTWAGAPRCFFFTVEQRVFYSVCLAGRVVSTTCLPNVCDAI